MQPLKPWLNCSVHQRKSHVQYPKPQPAVAEDVLRFCHTRLCHTQDPQRQPLKAHPQDSHVDWVHWPPWWRQRCCWCTSCWHSLHHCCRCWLGRRPSRFDVPVEIAVASAANPVQIEVAAAG